MENWIEIACWEADALLAQVLDAPCPVKSRYSRRGCIANPAPRALGVGEEVLQRFPESPYFQKITLEGGFFNFDFSLNWYDMVLKTVAAPPMWEYRSPVLKMQLCATVKPWDVSFLTALGRGKPIRKAWQAARQDRENPAWLVRYTAQRLVALEGRCEGRKALTEQERSLLRQAALLMEAQDAPVHLARYLKELTEMVWEASPQRLSEDVRRCLIVYFRMGMAHFADAL